MSKNLERKAKVAQSLAAFLEEHQADRVIAPRMKSGKFSLEELKEELKDTSEENKELMAEAQ